MTRTNDRTSKRRVAAVVALLLAGVGVWWLLQDDTEPQPSPATPAVGQENPNPRQSRPTGGGQSRADGRSESGIGNAQSTNRTDQVPADTQPAAPEPATLRPPVPRQLTVDGEAFPDELLNRIPPAGPDSDSVDFSTMVTGVVRDAAGNPVAEALVWADTESEGLGRMSQNHGNGKYERRMRQGAGMLTGNTQTRSGDDGSYHLRLTGRMNRRKDTGMASLAFTVHARKDSLLPQISCTVNYSGMFPNPPVPESFTGLDLTVALRTGSVAGRVVWASSGEACPGAAVALMRDDLTALQAQSVRIDASSHTGMTLPATVPLMRASKDGDFHFKGVPDGEYLCWAVEPGMAHSAWRLQYDSLPDGTRQASKLTVRNGEAVSQVTLEIPRLASLRFRTSPVLDAVPGVRLAARSLQESWSRTGVQAQEKWKPAPEVGGGYMIPRISPLHKFLVVIVPGYLAAEAPIVHDNGLDIDLGTIELDLGGAIGGRVVDETGRPMPGADVVAAADMGMGDLSRFGQSPMFSTVSANDGTFRLTGLDIQVRHTIGASLEGYHEGKALVSPRPAANAAEVVLTLARADAVVFGRVEFAEGHLAAATNFMTFPGGLRPTGRFVFAIDAESQAGKDLRPGRSTIHNNAEVITLPVATDWTFRKQFKPGKYKLVFTHGSETKILEAEAVAGQETEVVFRFGERSGIRGKVIGTDGNPLEGARVVLYGPTSSTGQMAYAMDPRVQAGTVQTDRDGLFHFPSLKPGSYLAWLPDHVTLQHHPDSMQSRSQRVKLADGADGEAVIDLSKPPVGAVVYMTLALNGVPQPSFGPRIAINQDARRTEHPGFFRLADGTMLAVGVPEGRHSVSYSVIVSTPRTSGVNGTVAFDVPPGAKEVRVHHDVVTATLSGTVVIPGGTQVSTSEIRVIPWGLTGPGGASTGSGASIIQVGEDGSFSKPNISHGWYRIEVRAPGFQPSNTEVEITKDTHVTLRLGDPAATIRLEYTGFSPELPPESVELAAERASAMEIVIRDSANNNAIGTPPSKSQPPHAPSLYLTGSMDIPNVTPGTVTVYVVHPMAEAFTAEVAAVSGQTTTVKVGFRLAPKLTLTLPASDVPPPAGRESVHIIVRREPTGGRMCIITLNRQADGSFSGSEYVPASGTAYLYTTAATVTPETASVTLAPGSSVSHTIRMVPK